MKRRDFIKYGSAGLAALVVGTKMPWLMDNPAYAAKPVPPGGEINFQITDALKEMVTHNTGLLPNGTRVGPGNPARCYFWIYRDVSANPLPPDCPGPIIFATSGDTFTLSITNTLDEDHSFAVPGLGFFSPRIAPKSTWTGTITASKAGAYLYYDYLNRPVNRMMGLHGAFIVMPRNPSGANWTPYDTCPPNIQQLFDDLGNKSGNSPWWPGLAWGEGDSTTDTPAFRQQIWVLHEASPNLFAEVGSYKPGKDYPAATFVQKFLHDPFNPVHDPFHPNLSNNVPQYFTISGQSGHFAHNNPWICPYSRVGEPLLIRICNAGLWLHSTHIHANHVFVLTRNNQFDPFPGDSDNPIWVDVYTANPLDTYDWLVPYMRPPDVPNDLGIGRDDLEQSLDVSTTAVTMGGFGKVPGGPPWVRADVPGADRPDNVAKLTWPPEQEIRTYIPNIGQVKGKAQDGVTDIDCAVLMSPVCFPMHDHSEPSQVAQGGNYNCGLISGILFTGDRKGARPGGSGVLTFPMRPYTGVDPVAHGPDMEPGQKGDWPCTKPFVVPSIDAS